MTLKSWRHWGIAARLLVIAVLPTTVMFVAVTLALYLTAQSEVRRDVASRGQLIATALAQSSQYGLVSGNVAYLRTTLRHVREADASIACVDILDPGQRTVVSECLAGPILEPQVIEVPVQLETLPAVDLFDADAGLGASPEPEPEPSAAPDFANAPAGQAPALRTIGRVRVTMTPAPILRNKQQAWLWASALVLGVAVMSCLIGLQLAQRLRHTLASVMAALRDVRRGRFDVQLSTDSHGELGELQRTIVQMAGTLGQARHDLEQQVAMRTLALQRAVDRVRQADAEKRRLIVHSNAVVEEERRRIALEIHDHLGAALISVRLEASALLAKAESTHDEDMARSARRIAGTTESLYGITRNIVKSLRPEVIDTLGLRVAVEELVGNMDQVHPACRFSCLASDDLPDLRGEQAMPAYRVTQEALTNVAKHAGATLVQVSLALTPDRQHLRLVIDDNGSGFEVGAVRRTGIGLIGMRERVAAAGGEMIIDSTPGHGTRVEVTLPLEG